MNLRLLLGALSLLASLSAAAQTADTILVNGKVVTGDERATVRQALAVRDGRIVAAGSNADVRRLDTERLVQLLTLGSKVQKVLEMKDRLTRLPGRIGGRSAKPD